MQGTKAAGVVFRRIDAPSSQFPYVSAARSGRAAVAPRFYKELEPLVSLSEGAFAAVPARHLILPPRSAHLVVERPGTKGGFEVRRQSGELVLTRTAIAGSHALAEDDRFYIAGKGYTWSRESDITYEPTFNPGGEALATAVLGRTIRAVVASTGGALPHQPPEPDFTRAEMTRLDGANAAVRFGWFFMAREPGVAAIDAAGQTVVALSSGRFKVLGPEGTAQDEAIVALDVAIEPNATDVSIVPPYAMVLYGGGAAGELAQRRGQAFPGSRLRAVREDGTVAWTVAIPFVPRQPPVDGEDKVVLVGLGLAAVNLKGEILWTQPSPVPLRATAFADGTLAVTRGAELQLLAPDGSVRQTLRAAEELTSAPALGADGSVWVASAKTLYVAR